MLNFILDMFWSFLYFTFLMCSPILFLFLYPAMFGKVKRLSELAKFSFICGSLSVGIGTIVIILYIPVVSAFVKVFPSWCTSFPESGFCQLVPSISDALGKIAMPILAFVVIISTILVPPYISKKHWNLVGNVNES